MSGIGKCTSLWGHKFEPRYSVKETLAFDVGAQELTVELIEAMRGSRTYERDICMNCGGTVEKLAAKEGK